MKRSNIMILSALAVIFISLVTLLIVLKVSVDQYISFSDKRDPALEPSGIVETISLSYNNFDSLSFESIWDVVVEEGEEFRIEITADKALLDKMKIEKRGKTVHFSDKNILNSGSGIDYNHLVLIEMPDLELIEFTGMGNILLKNFELDELHIINSGASYIEAENVSIERLSLIIDGAANAELSRIDIQNCYLDISGAANIELNMSGGELTGLVSGAATVVYSGDVQSETVKAAGIASLERR